MNKVVRFRPQRSSLEDSLAHTVEIANLNAFVKYINARNYYNLNPVFLDQVTFVELKVKVELPRWEKFIVLVSGNGIGYVDQLFDK